MHDLPVLTPVDESGRFYDDYGWLHGLSTTEAADQIIGELGETGFLVEAALYTHALPALLALRHAAHLPALRRLVHLGRGDPAEAARGEREGRVGARVHGQAHGRLAAQHGRLEHLAPPLLRAAAAVLPVLVRAPERDRLEGRARRARDRGLRRSSRSCAARGSTACRSAASSAARSVTRVPEVGDVWLDAGIVPFSTLGWENPEWIPEGYATGAARGLTHADLPDHAYWEKWFPADWVSEMREQIRLWFYSQFFMSVVLVGRSPYKRVLGYEKMLDEHGPRDARLVGEHDRGRGRVRADGRRRDALAVLRAAARPQPALRLRAGARDQAQAAHVLELGRVPRRLRRTSRASRRRGTRLEPDGELRPLDRWLVARTQQLVAEATAAYEATLTVDVDPRLRGVRRRPLELVHPPLAAALLLVRRGGVPDALVRARPVAARHRAGDAVPRPTTSGGTSSRTGRRRCTSRRGRSRRSRTARCSPRSPRCAASSSSAGRRGRRRS